MTVTSIVGQIHFRNNGGSPEVKTGMETGVDHVLQRQARDRSGCERKAIEKQVFDAAFSGNEVLHQNYCLSGIRRVERAHRFSAQIFRAGNAIDIADFAGFPGTANQFIEELSPVAGELANPQRPEIVHFRSGARRIHRWKISRFVLGHGDALPQGAGIGIDHVAHRPARRSGGE